jgi:hypothetical protein
MQQDVKGCCSQVFFTTGKPLKKVNSTILSLIPTVPNPTTVADVIYKCITKVLANRLRNFLEILINANQTALIKGRSIPKNVLLAHELVKNYQTSKGLGRCAIKTDLRKAYGSVDWRFILMCLISNRFPPKFVN